ncbi:hypothetical protein GCM10027359_08600 [Marilutibacter aestuarii]
MCASIKDEGRPGPALGENAPGPALSAYGRIGSAGAGALPVLGGAGRADISTLTSSYASGLIHGVAIVGHSASGETEVQIVFLLISLAAFFGGVLLLGGAKSAIHEILAGVTFLIWAVFFVGAGVIGAIREAAKELLAAQQK